MVTMLAVNDDNTQTRISIKINKNNSNNKNEDNCFSFNLLIWLVYHLVVYLFRDRLLL